MKLYSYTMTDDTGFAPCVSKGMCSLACCKPVIRRVALEGSWIMGNTGVRYGTGKLIFLMQVGTPFSFKSYWDKYPGRLDNIYKPSGLTYKWQDNPFHRKPSEQQTDLSTDRVLTSTRFVYLGKEAVKIPKRFARFICSTRGHRAYEEGFESFVEWAFSIKTDSPILPHSAVPSSAFVPISSLTAKA